MDHEKLTTRKRFMQKAGLAFAGVFTLSAATKSASRNSIQQAAQVSNSNPFKRIRPAQGAVQRTI